LSGITELLANFRAVRNYAIAATCQRAADNSTASNTPEELLAAIESVVFVPRVFGVGKLLLKIVEAMVTDHLPFFISEVCIL